MPGTGPLKLRAHDIEDLRALGACLQDALVPVADLAYLKAEKRFVMVANRFKWEGGAKTAPGSENSHRLPRPFVALAKWPWKAARKAKPSC